MTNKISVYCIMSKKLSMEQIRNLQYATFYESPEGKLYMKGYYDLKNTGNYRGYWTELIPPQFIGSEKIEFQFVQGEIPGLKKLDDLDYTRRDPRREKFQNGLKNYLATILYGGRTRKNIKKNKKYSKLRSKKYSKLRSKKRTIKRH